MVNRLESALSWILLVWVGLSRPITSGLLHEAVVVKDASRVKKIDNLSCTVGGRDSLTCWRKEARATQIILQCESLLLARVHQTEVVTELSQMWLKLRVAVR